VPELIISLVNIDSFLLDSWGGKISFAEIVQIKFFGCLPGKYVRTVL